jgi:hypothetical protein
MCKDVSSVDHSPRLIPPVRLHISVKTKVQQRALAGEMYRSPRETLHRLIRGEFGS